jgi:hypothetical protein
MAASLGVRELQFSRCESLLLEAGSLGTGIFREPRVKKTASGDSNRLRILVCVWQWSVKCSLEMFVWVVNKSRLHSKPRLWSLIHVTIYESNKQFSSLSRKPMFYKYWCFKWSYKGLLKYDAMSFCMYQVTQREIYIKKGEGGKMLLKIKGKWPKRIL